MSKTIDDSFSSLLRAGFSFLFFSFSFVISRSTVDREEFRSGLVRLGVKLSGPEFEACWQYADPRGEVALTKKKLEITSSINHGLPALID